MRKVPLRVLLVVATFVIALWYVMTQYNFTKTTNRTIVANLYSDGVVTGKTQIVVDGEIKYGLISDEQTYKGFFGVECCDYTCREDMVAHIGWYSSDTGRTLQTIYYEQYASFPNTEIVNELLIDKDMYEVAIGLVDGTVIATSEQMYSRFCLSRTK